MREKGSDFSLTPASGEAMGADADQLRAFVAVARMGTVGRAAHALSRTQPSISARLADLESSWATRLFHRRARGMDLTPEGERLLPLAVATLDSLEELNRSAGSPLAGGATLRVGAGDALGREIVPDALKNVLKEYPGVEVRITEGPGGRILGALERGEIDVALVTGSPDRVPGRERSGARLDFQLLLESPVVVLIPLDRKPRGKLGVGLSWLAGERLVTLQPGSSFRRLLEESLAERGHPFHPAVEVGSFSLVRRYVATGLGVAPVPEIAFRRDSHDGQVLVRRLREVAEVPYFSAVRSAVPLPPPARMLLDSISAELSGRR
jgi:DNA-binding transcriptional LysR family regulator